MAKPNLTEVYEALRVAEAEGRADDVAKLIDYIESVEAAPDVAAEETFDPRELISPVMPAAGGAAAGAIVPKVIESGIDAMEAGRKPQGVLGKAPISINGVPEGHTPYNPRGRSVEGSVQNWRSYNDAQLEAAKKVRQESAMHKKYPGFTRAGTNPVLAPLPKNAAPAERIAAKMLPGGASDIANFAKGIYDYKLPFVGSMGSLAGRGLVGAGAGIQGTDAYNRYKMGDTTGAAISGLGALGTASSLIPHPAAKVIGGGVGLTAEAINAYRDAMRRGQIEHGAPENYENVDQMGNSYAQGGLVHLAGGGKPIPELPAWFPQITGYKAKDNSDDERLFEMGSNPEMVAQDLKQNLSKNINLGDPNYLRGVDTIEADTPMGRGVVGQYAHIDPHKISVRSNMGIPMDTARVLGHEAQHSQEADASKRNYKDSKNDTLLQAARREAAGKGSFDLRKQIDENYKNYVKDYLAKQDAKSGNFGWAMDNGRTLGDYYIDPDIGPHYKSDERFADFAGLESILPRGQRLADTELGKAVFKTPEQASYYYQTVRPLEPKMLPQNPDNESEWIKSRRRMADVAEQNKYKNRGVGSVFLDQIKAAMGKADGGQVQHFQAGRIVKAARELMLPAAENAARTQIIGTLPTYGKAADIFAKQGATGQALDFGAGLGKGADLLGPGTHTYEPFAQGWNPTYTNAKDIPSDAYNRLTNLNVLNVVPRDIRDEMVLDIGRTMEPGGTGIITTRGADVMKAKGRPGPEPTSIITSRDTYQKGFTKQELEDYLRYMLGQGYDINKLNLGPAGAMIQKKAAGGLAHLADGGQPPKPNADEGAAFIGYRPAQRQEKNKYGAATGFLDALVGAPPSKENILDPRDFAYMQGYEKGEPYGIAAMALPFAGMAAKPLAREIGTRAFMGEPLMPKMVRPVFPEMKPMGIIKNEKGGNWMPEKMSDYNSWTPENQLAETLGFNKNDPALENWVNTQLTRYVKNEMGTPGDPIRALADKGVIHYKPRPSKNAEGQFNNVYYRAEDKRAMAGMPEGESALTQLGKDWESNVDLGINTNTIDDKMISEFGNEFPWLEKSKGQKLNSIDQEFLYSELGFDHMVDVLREQMAAGILRPESMKSLSVPQAVQRTHEYNLAKEKAMQKVQLQAQSEMPVAKEYPEQGYKWLELKHPTDPSVTEKALKYEGDAMGHCVGGYCSDVEAGSTKIYSLRDAKGEPHVTIEVRPGNHHLGFEYPQGANSNAQFPKDFYYTDSEGIRQSLPPQQHAEIYSRAKELFEQNPGSVMRNLQQAATEVLGAPPSTIQQIKGKQNAAVKDEYKKYVQDFVKSGNWEQVKEAHNAGLIPTSDLSFLADIYPKNEALHDLNKISRLSVLNRAVREGEKLPKYITREEYEDILQKYVRNDPWISGSRK
jgi:hypothetical protein